MKARAQTKMCGDARNAVSWLLDSVARAIAGKAD